MRRRYRQRAAPQGKQCRCHEAVQRGQGLNTEGLLRVISGLQIKYQLFKEILIGN